MFFHVYCMEPSSLFFMLPKGTSSHVWKRSGDLQSCSGTAAHYQQQEQWEKEEGRALQFNSGRVKESRWILLSCFPTHLFTFNHLSERIGSLQQAFWNFSLARTTNLFVSFMALLRAAELDLIDYRSAAFCAFLTSTGPKNPSLIFYLFIFLFTIISGHRHPINKVICLITPNKHVKEEGKKRICWNKRAPCQSVPTDQWWAEAEVSK